MIIKDEYDYLIHLLKCAVNDLIPEEIPDGMLFEKIYKYALFHDVANIAFCSVERLDGKPDKELYLKWQNRHDLAVTRDINQEFAANEIRQAFSEKEILFTEIQGTKIKKFYPAPEYRTMSDIDFVVEEKKLEQAENILCSLGYKCEVHGNGDVVASRSANINVELHRKYFTGKFEGVMDVDFTRDVTDEELYVYTYLHLVKHYFEEGCGIRRVLDIYLLDKNFPEFWENEWVRNCFEKAGVQELAGELKCLAGFWFGGETEPENAGKMKKYFTESGVHGIMEHRVQNNLGSSKFRYLWGRVFQKKELIYLRYPFIRKYKFLLPIGWVMRFFYGVTHFKEKRVMDEIKTVKETEKR